MKLSDLSIQAPAMQNPADMQNMAAFVSQLNELLKYIADNLSSIRVVTTAPVASEIQTTGDNRGNVLSEVMILDNDTQTSRRIYYKNKAGTLRLIESD